MAAFQVFGGCPRPRAPRAPLAFFCLASVLLLLGSARAGQIALGSLDGAFGRERTYEMEKFLQRRLVFRSFLWPWSTENKTVEECATNLRDTLDAGAVPVIVWDPYLGDNYKDTLNAINNGLHDQLINAFFSQLKSVLQEGDGNAQGNTTTADASSDPSAPETGRNPDQMVLVVFGSTCNSPYVYWSSNSTLFASVYRKVRTMCSQDVYLSRRVLWVWSLDPTRYTPTEESGGYAYDSALAKKIYPPGEYFPGESYVDWIFMQIMNDDPEIWRWPEEYVRLGVGIASELAGSAKPVAFVVGTMSNGEVAMKEEWLSRFTEEVVRHTEPTEKSTATARLAILNNKESNFDTGFYHSTNGDVNVSTGGNGDYLYTYRILPELLATEDVIAVTGNSSVITEVGPEIAYGAICGPGRYAQPQSTVCAFCEAGTYNNESGRSSCTDCPVGTYNDDVGQTECKPCPENTTTTYPGARNPQFCQCAENFEAAESGGAVVSGGAPECVPCKKNYYSRGQGGKCIPCPSDAIWPSGAKPGCYCKKGYTWSGARGECLRQSDTGAFRRGRPSFLAMVLGTVYLGGVLAALALATS